MNDPRIPALLVSHRRPGFYFRVLQEGEVRAGDEIIKLASGPEEMTVAEVDALLYLPGHSRQQLLRALRIPALSPGWQASFKALLEGGRESGNAGLVATSPPPAWTGVRRLKVTAIKRESNSVISISFADPDGAAARRPARATAKATRTLTANAAIPARSRGNGPASWCAKQCAPGTPNTAAHQPPTTGRSLTRAGAGQRRLTGCKAAAGRRRVPSPSSTARGPPREPTPPRCAPD